MNDVTISRKYVSMKTLVLFILISAVLTGLVTNYFTKDTVIKNYVLSNKATEMAVENNKILISNNIKLNKALSDSEASLQSVYTQYNIQTNELLVAENNIRVLEYKQKRLNDNVRKLNVNLNVTKQQMLKNEINAEVERKHFKAFKAAALIPEANFKDFFKRVAHVGTEKRT